MLARRHGYRVSDRHATDANVMSRPPNDAMRRSGSWSPAKLLSMDAAFSAAMANSVRRRAPGALRVPPGSRAGPPSSPASSAGYDAADGVNHSRGETHELQWVICWRP